MYKIGLSSYRSRTKVNTRQSGTQFTLIAWRNSSKLTFPLWSLSSSSNSWFTCWLDISSPNSPRPLPSSSRSILRFLLSSITRKHLTENIRHRFMIEFRLRIPCTIQWCPYRVTWSCNGCHLALLLLLLLLLLDSTEPWALMHDQICTWVRSIYPLGCVGLDLVQ